MVVGVVFSMGRGGWGFLMGLAGSWLLFTGLVGAWLSAILIIPKIKKLDMQQKFLTYPDYLRYKFDNKVAMVAALISGIGYLGFTGGQILAGAKLASSTLFNFSVFGLAPLDVSLYLIAGIILIYTVLGGIKAVIYTDTVQWIILLSGLLFFALPFALFKVGGFAGLYQALPKEFFTLTNIDLITFINWMVTIIPVWLVAMTIYQRIYATKDVKQAQKAWFMAGLFEYPIMAFIGVVLGMISRVMFPTVEAEMGLPMLLQAALPIGITGIVVSAYFSAIMSTADSCLIASSGNFVNDILERTIFKNYTEKHIILVSQLATLLIGITAIVIAASFQTVLEVILHAYAFLVSGLFAPTLISYFSKKLSSRAALFSMLLGGGFTLLSIFLNWQMPLGIDNSFYGILLSFFSYYFVCFLETKHAG
jgi:SSS family solute:Na+ symporter